MKVAVYARVSTDDKDQNPETQLMAAREFARARDFSIAREYVDEAKATDLRGRKEWRELLLDAGRRRFDAVLVFKLDRAFRSVKHMHETLGAWEIPRIGFISVRESFADTSTAMGRLMMNMLASFAEFELETIRERVVAGMERARERGTRSGKAIGRPGLEVNAGDGYLARTEGLSIRQLAARFGISRGSVGNLLAEASKNGGRENGVESEATTWLD